MGKEFDLPIYQPDQVPSAGGKKYDGSGQLVVPGSEEEKRANLAFVSELLGLPEPAKDLAGLINQIEPGQDHWSGEEIQEMYELLCEAAKAEKIKNN